MQNISPYIEVIESEVVEVFLHVIFQEMYDFAIRSVVHFEFGFVLDMCLCPD